MKLRWIIQDKVFGQETNNLVKYIDPKQLDLVSDFSKIKSIDLSEYRIVRGSTKFVQDYYCKFAEYDYALGLCLDINVYDCSKYYQKVNGLLNHRCIFMPWGMLKKEFIQELIFWTFDHCKFFIRPNSGRKIFTGTTITQKWFAKELDIIAGLPSTSGLNDETMCVVADFQTIKAEARFLMCENQVIDFSVYSGGFNNKTAKSAIKLAESNNYYPDKLYTIDICVNELDDLYILEYNSFVSAGLYDMDPAKIIKAVEECYAEGMLSDCD